MRKQSRAVLMLLILLASTIVVPMPTTADDEESESWDPLSQPWAQYGRDPGHSRILPEHGDSGLSTIETPAINWVAFDSGQGADGYGVAIANMSASITAPEGAKERCGENHLFAVLTYTENTQRNLAIIEGDTAKIAWEVSLGNVDVIRSTPVIVDVDGDSKQEIAIVYDSDSALEVDLWSPDITCDESGWTVSGHSNEKLWSWSDADLRIGINNAHLWTAPEAVTQPLLADLSLDGSPELIIAAVDTTNDEPTVVALPLGLQSPEEDWRVALDRGSHPSDPAFAALDDNSGSVVLTTVDENSGNFWVWRIDGPTGSLDWERVSIQGTDSDDDTPRLRLPGPVITQLDADAPPEMILTLPSDSNGGDDGMGAQYVGMELTSTDEIWRFRAKNGYADAEPLPVDTTGDGITDRVCWVTWFSTGAGTTDRDGVTGCHDITIDPPFREWTRILQSGSGNDNEGEVAVSAPISIDLDGEDEPELLVAYGERIFAFDGNTGTSADIGIGWSSSIDVPHRTWASPAVADMDGDGYLDILVGDTLISEAKSDVAPLADGRGIGFTPTDPDPGEMVTISGQYSNIGIVDTDDPVDAVLMMNGIEIKRHRVNIAEATAPSGEGGPITFSVDIEATLGVHTVELILDVNNNLTQTRTDNDNYSTTLVVLEPHVAQIQTPSEVSRALPGNMQSVNITVTSTGSRDAAWTMNYNDSGLPTGWTFAPKNSADLSLNLERDSPQIIEFEFYVPTDALGSDDAQVPLTLTLDQDQSISTTVTLPLEVQRTRGLSLQGATGLPSGIGFGRPGDVAHVWLMVENVGNAQETTEMQWSSNSWGSSTTIVDYSGNTQWGIELGPNAMQQYLIEVEVPSSSTLGDSTSTTLTLCIGSGSEEICEDFSVTIYASDVASDIPHIRTVPSTGLSWDIESNYAGSVLQWDMSAAGMLKEGWNWSTNGDLSINGTMLEMTGQNGQLNLDLPLDAPPMRHYFNQTEQSQSHTDLSISLHVLQVFRAEAEVVTPSDGAVFNVSERTKLILRLQNPGNGEDSFLLSGSTTAGNLSEAPNVTFEISNPLRTLGPGGISMVPVWVTLPEDVPARENFQLIFDWSSTGNPLISDQANITIEARPDHRWEIQIEQGENILVTPGQELNLTINLTNIGNTDDLLTLTPNFEITYEGNDASNWAANAINSSRLDVFESQTIHMVVDIPDDTWATTTAELTLLASSSGFNIDYNVSTTLEVSAVAGWRIDLTNTSLEVPPSGGELELLIEQKGNSPAKPYFAKAGQGWNVTIPNNGEMISPGESGTINITVTPPSNAVAGEVGVVSIRISNGNGAGEIVEQVPVRVGSEPGIIIDSKSQWKVREGVQSWPTAWIENTGNDVAIMDLSIPNLPSDWTLNGEGVIVVAPNEIKGVPLQLEPSSSWNGNNIQLDIELVHPVLGTLVHSIEINQSDTVLTSSPVHTGRTGEKVSITTDSLANGIETSLIPLPNIRSNTTHNGMTLHLVGIPSPLHTAECQNVHGNLDELGIGTTTKIWTTCVITANPEHALVANAWLRASNGDILDNGIIRLSPGQNTTLNLSVTSWDPQPGLITVDAMIVDSNGLSLHSKSSTHIVRQSGWNLQVDLIVNEDYIEVGIGREGYLMMEGSVCRLDIATTDGNWETSIALDIFSNYGTQTAPRVTLDRPSEVDDGAEVSATVSCLAPWDVDDNPEDDTMTTYASKRPLVTYESTDIYWSGGVAILMLIIAYFGGILNLRKPVPEKKEVPLQVKEPVQKKTEPEIQVVSEDIDLDDISFDEDIGEPDITEDEPEPLSEPIVEPEEEVIDIDDSSASGRLSALRKEMDSDSDGQVSKSREDLAKRMDSFLKDR
ncbi:MAG: hypothetical protein CMB28_06315 [Euryarchaeota archaeon]|nr:hypothetical protein [Euryarchaeota archaeon]